MDVWAQFPTNPMGAATPPANVFPKDSVKSAVLKISTQYVTEDEINRNIPLHHIDTNPNGAEIFHNLYKNYTVFQDLGNIGTPSRSLIFNTDRHVGFRLCNNPFEGYWMKPEETKFYNTKTPYTDLFYAQGSNELIYLLARHTQNILPRWNVGADLQRITSVGFIGRQNTSIYNYQFFTRYTSKNKKYELIAHATWNRGVVEESGGIQIDTSFETLTGTNKKVLSNLNSSQTRFKSRTAYVKQYWHFGNLEQIINKEDTIYEMHSTKQLSYSIKAEETSFIFENLKGDTNSTLLPHQYYDVTTNTLDSTYFGKIENRIAYDMFTGTQIQLKDSIRKYMGIGFTHAMIVTSQNPYVRNYQNILCDFTYENIKLKNNTISEIGYLAYNFAGYNSGDYKLKVALKYRTYLFDLGVNAEEQLYKPDYNFLFNKSNQFLWNNENTFNKTQTDRIGFQISTRRFRNNFHLTVNSYILNNWVYINTSCLPTQSASTIMVNTVQLNKTFRLWKFYFEHFIYYQQTNNDVIRVPELSGKIRYYFQSRFKTMKFQLGFDVFYNTAYYGNNYNPATRQFYLQNDRLIGNYPLFEPFITSEIKRVIFFFKYEHLNQDWLNNNGYYYTPHYPLSLSSFRIGIRWRYYD